MKKRNPLYLVFIFLAFLILSCEIAEDLADEIAETAEALSEGEDWYDEDWETEEAEATDEPYDPDAGPTTIPPTSAPLPDGMITEKFDLWSNGETLLRGANIWQSIVIPDLDGLEYKGSGPVGPPFSQEDFTRLSALGANYVNISGPGLFTETPPFVVDMEVVEYLDELLDKIAQADLFAVISFRTGPGRSEYGLCCDEDDPMFQGYFNDSVWEDLSAQDAWTEMWKFTAQRYRNNPIVVGYKLMVEPNASGIYFDIWEPDDFYDNYAGTSYDWNQFYPRIVDAIREVDADTPILVNAEGYSGVDWLPYLEVVDDPRIVYIAHQYEPQEDYTHQDPNGQNSYPGRFDLDWDGSPDDFDRDWLEDFLSPISEFSASHGVPVAVDEYGVNRWVPGADAYMDDIMDLFEEMGVNHSFWEWSTSWPDFEEDVHDMNYLFGPDPHNLTFTDNDLLDAITRHWSQNTVRPSNAPWNPMASQKPASTFDLTLLLATLFLLTFKRYNVPTFKR